jgi:dienelactone hydrolase
VIVRSRNVALLVVLSLLMTSCVLNRPTTEPVEGLLFEHALYAAAGPYEVGVTTLQLDDREVEVWYPATRGATQRQEPDSYFIRDFTSPIVQSLLPPEINPPFVTDAYRDVRSFRGREFPVVLFSHGAVSYRNQSSFLTTHLASWGFVVASPDFLERGLQSFLGPQPETPKTSLEVLDETLALLTVENNTSGGPLFARLDLDTVLPIGHSAGGGASAQFVIANGAAAWSPMAAGASGPTDPGSSGLWIAGANDQIAELAGVEAAFAAAPGPKRLVVIDGAGHNNAFSDICEIGTGGGGVIALAREAGLPIPDSLARLGEDGCKAPNVPSEDVWPVVRHFVTAHLRFQGGITQIPWGLDDDVVDRFDVPVTYTQIGAAG